MKAKCTKCNFQSEVIPCPNIACDGILKVESQSDSRFTTALKEGRCYICGTSSGSSIKIPDGIFQVETKMAGLIPICNLCSVHMPEHYSELSTEHITWEILKKRLNQYTVYSKTCKFCGVPMTSVRKEKSFCSNNCRSKFWLKSHKLQP